jgi:hypothetical protein
LGHSYSIARISNQATQRGPFLLVDGVERSQIGANALVAIDVALDPGHVALPDELAALAPVQPGRQAPDGVGRGLRAVAARLAAALQHVAQGPSDQGGPCEKALDDDVAHP